jgi:hypothetical protein
MEKRSLMYNIPKGNKIKEEPILSGLFMRIKNDHTTLRLYELYDKFIVCYNVITHLI